MNNSSENIRIAKNTVFVYIRLFVTIAAGLITSRLVLKALGADDYGLYNVVGSVIALFGFITASLAGTTQRFINHELGKPGGDPGRIFNICNALHIGCAIILFLLIEVIGLVYISNWLNVAPGKEGDAMFVFQVSTIVACIGIANVPFQSLFTAHEKFKAVAVIEIFFTLVKLGLVVLLLFCKGNLLKLYAIFMSVSTALSFVIYHYLCYKYWPDTVRWNFVRERKEYKEALAFNNYNLLAAGANVAKWQGSNVLLNFFFGTAVNAAYGIANLVTSYVEKFTGNIAMAAAPQIIQSHSANDGERTHYLAHTVTRLSLLVVLVLFFSAMPEIELLLRLWLGDRVPEGTAIFCRYTLLLGILGTTTIGLIQVINASGKIKWFKIQFSIIYVAVLFIGFAFYKHGASAPTLLILYIIGDALSRIIFLVQAKTILGYPVGSFIRRAYTRPIIIAGILTALLFVYRHFRTGATSDGIVATALFFALACILAWSFGLSSKERSRIVGIFARKTFYSRRKLLYRLNPRKAIKEDLAREGFAADLDNPRNINEKMLWLMTDKTSRTWGRYADKIAVRGYVASKGYADLIVPILGIYKKSKEIDFNALPQKFVLKCNHDSGSALVIDKAAGFDKAAVCARFDEALKQKYGFTQGELYYNSIKPRIIAEPFLEAPKGSLSIPDYKVWCFNGKPEYIWACVDRTAESVHVHTYDTAWNPVDNADVQTGHYIPSTEPLPRPRHLEKMLEAAAAISQGFPEVRVDFFESEGKLYFAEMTFAALGGRVDFHTPEFLLELGKKCILK